MYMKLLLYIVNGLLGLAQAFYASLKIKHLHRHHVESRTGMLFCVTSVFYIGIKAGVADMAAKQTKTVSVSKKNYSFCLTLRATLRYRAL